MTANFDPLSQLPPELRNHLNQYLNSSPTNVLNPKQSVRAATTANITLSGEQTVDGVALVASESCLVKNQVAGENNGIYIVTTGAWVRRDDADTAAKLQPNSFFFVQEGTTNGDTGWMLGTNSPITLGSTVLTFTQFTGTGLITAGAGLTKTGNTLDVVANADGSIAVNANDIQVGILATDAQHGSRGGGTQHAVATGAVAGFMSAVDKTAFDSIVAAPVLSIGAASGFTGETNIQALTTTLPFVLDDASTDTILDVVSLTRTTSGGSGAGIGSGLLFRSEDGLDNLEDVAEIQGVLSVVTDTAEESQIRLRARAGGAALTECFRVLATNAISAGPAAVISPLAAGGILFFGTGANDYIRWTGTNIAFSTGGALLTWDGVAFFPADLTKDSGAASGRWSNTWSRQYNGVVFPVTFSATPTFNVANGETQQITLTDNITSWTVTAGNPGEILTLLFTQDGVGTRTLAAPPGNVLVTAGTYTLTVTSGKTDSLSLRYNGTNWYEIGRAMNL